MILIFLTNLSKKAQTLDRASLTLPQADQISIFEVLMGTNDFLGGLSNPLESYLQGNQLLDPPKEYFGT